MTKDTISRLHELTISRLVDLPDRSRAVAEVEAIFFESSATRSFDSDADRASFHERWLGRYITHWPAEVFVAGAESGAVVGYLVGCLIDPTRTELFADVSYFADFAHLTERYPGHLHINVTARCRNRGIGSCLIEAFAQHVARAGVPGMHAVTGEGSRNNRFYLACGFELLSTGDWNGNRIAFFGRRLPGREGQPWSEGDLS